MIPAAVLASVHEIAQILELSGVSRLVADGFELVHTERLREHVVRPSIQLKALRFNGKLAHVAIVQLLRLKEREKIHSNQIK